ncbi:MAG: chromosome segregation protein SMC [Pirellulales bacterium]
MTLDSQLSTLMLKALELSGFKSFADRTRFDFPSGICVVVGPNGSGKSNVVDAVKWVLGSQSAKSLRGKEMTDVIFNGCPTRQPMGTSEVTLTLNNSDRRLPIDADEVYVGRRVYRSGEGEYLLNRQPCRLRDVREVLATTGITTEAYCIIEQGKVDALLQSSPQNRRIIFEEAAGISQFKAKKAVAARRMERVEQNLLRLSDIVDEVESRLRSIRSQAGKARKYRECVERLQQLRTEVALVDWRQFTHQLDARQVQFTELKRRVDDGTAGLDLGEAEAQQFELQLEAGVQQSRATEEQLAKVREQIAGTQAKIDSQTARRADLQDEIVRLRDQLTAMRSAITEDSDDEFRSTTAQREAAELGLAAIVLECSELSALAESVGHELQALRGEHECRRAQHAESIRNAARLGEHLHELEQDLTAARKKQTQFSQQLVGMAQQRAGRSAELAAAQQAEAEQAAIAEQHRLALTAAERRLAEVRRDLSRADVQHRRLDAQLTRVRERIAVLSELESRLEGLDGGVQEILRAAQEDATHRLGDVRGVVADLFHVDVDSAPLVEVALGERAQFIVVASTRPLLEWLHGQPLKVVGRVGFFGLEGRLPMTALDHVDLSAEPGVMGRADSFVESEADYHILARRLLGRTWLVDRLSTALRLAQSIGRGLEFVTTDGELITADGTVIVGPRQAATGVLSRRSELRACHEQARGLEEQLTGHATTHAQLDQERARQEELVASSVAAYTSAAGMLAQCHRRTAAAAAQLDRVMEQQQRFEDELQTVATHIAERQTAIENAAAEQTAAHAMAAQLEIAIAAGEQQLLLLNQQHAEQLAATTDKKIAVAKSEQRLEMLRQQVEQLQRGQQEREQMLAESQERLTAREAQVVELETAMAADVEIVAGLLAAKDQLAAALAQHSAAADAIRRQRQVVLDRVRTERQQISNLQAQMHKLEVTVSRLRHERQTLCERMQDDYGINLEEAAAEVGGSGLGAGGSQAVAPAADSENTKDGSAQASVPAPPTKKLDRDRVEREIAELRNQINNIGAINLEALDELEQLETRFATLSGQYRDLVDAKAALERITQRINTDSRQLFLTTVDTVRGHFQELFRRLFGGGEANIIVDENEDVLECGIEIVARPPGKEACSISLLSGGEKTLTCVALLLAVFRSKPSPFCILDEVDAALDEANIGRFTAVLREFLSFTQFIVITHSKKTMSGADTLYGVTMEESGVSKRVSVRFEDVSEDGHILPSAMFHANEMQQNAARASTDSAEPERRAA